MTPCSPPIMLVSMVGHAIRQTAGRSGPSMIDRSKRRFSPAGVEVAGASGLSDADPAAVEDEDEAVRVTILLIGRKGNVSHRLRMALPLGRASWVDVGSRREHGEPP